MKLSSGQSSTRTLTVALTLMLCLPERQDVPALIQPQKQICPESIPLPTTLQQISALAGLTLMLYLPYPTSILTNHIATIHLMLQDFTIHIEALCLAQLSMVQEIGNRARRIL